MAPPQATGPRAVIVGAGVTGLTAAHALHRAGVDYVVVERHADVAPPLGVSIGLYPSTLRILRQLRVLGRVRAAAQTFTDGFRLRDPRGTVTYDQNLWACLRENHGDDMLALERRELIQILYEELPDKSKVLLGRAVAGIRQSENGVEVELADGTSQRGDLVIGADGVHSIVREAMWQHADAAEPGLITDDERNIMMRNWVCLFGLGPGEPGLRNELSVTSYPGKRAAMTITQPRLTTFLFFWKAETATALSRPESAARFTAQDADRAAAGVAHLPVNETMVFGDFWNKRTRAQLSHIEEGVLTRWHYGRLVLAGDAVHKVTPNTAYGGNLAIEGVAVLANQLHRAVVEQRRRREGSGRCDGDGDQEEKDEATPSWGAASLAQADLEAAFRAYQARHESRAREVCATAHWVTRLQTWDTPWLKFWSLYVMPLSDRKALARIIGALVRRAPLLDFVPLDRGPEGKVRWEHGETRSDDGYGKPWRGALAALAAVGLVASFAFFIRRWPLSGYTAREALSSDL